MGQKYLTPLELLKQFCIADYVERDREKALRCLSSDIHWFGTSDAEDVYSISEADEYIRKEIASSPAPYKIRFLNERETTVQEGIGSAALKMAIEAEGLSVLSRITCMTKLEEGQAKICEMHTSIPEVTQEDDEYFPFEFAKQHDIDVVHEFLDTMLPAGILGIYLDPGFPLAMMNHVMLSFLGYPNEEEFRKATDNLTIYAIHPEDRLILDGALEERISKGEELKTLLRIQKSDGSYFWADVRGVQGTDGQKREVLVCLCLDAAEMMRGKPLPEGSCLKLQEEPEMSAGEEQTPREYEEKPMYIQRTSENMPEIPWSAEKQKKPWKRVLAVAAAVFVLIIAAVIFTSYLLDSQWKAEKSSISTASLAGAECVSNAVSADQEVLAGMADILGSLPEKASAQNIFQENTLSGFREIIVIYNDGSVYSSLGREPGKAEEIIRNLKFAENSSKSKTYSGETGKKQIAYREDVMSEGKKKGVLYGVADLSKYYVPEVMEFYEGKGFSYVIEAESGEFIIYTPRKISQGSYSDLYSALSESESSEEVQELKKTILNGGSGSAVADMPGKKTYMHFVPVDTDKSMYLITMVPYDVMKRESSGMVYLVAAFIAAVLLTMVLVILFNNRVAETKIREREYREILFRILAENIDSVFLIFDSESKEVEYASENMERILGVAHKRLMQEGSEFEWPEENRKEIREFMKKKQNFLIDFSYRNPEKGQRQLLRISGYVPEGTAWQKKWMFCINDRTDDVFKERRLEQAVREADEANTAKSEFLANMSHDIRTPMNGIIGLTQLALMKDVSTDTMRCYMEKIATSSAFLLTLINDVLDMSKIESGKIELHPKPYSMKELSEYLDSVILPQAREKNIEFTADIDWGIVISVDQQRFNQILFNLLSNAVKYTENHGSVSLTIRSENKGKGLLHLVICVEDNGIGMSQEFQKQMFRPFTQESRKITGLNGTGLGLAIVKKLADLMGGRIRVESSVGKGSRFFLEMDVLAAEPEDCINEKEHSGDDYELRKKARILLCEDNLVNQEIMMGILEAIDIEAELAADGMEGFEKYQSHSAGYYDAVLMDCRMPVMDGYEATRAIRASKRPDAAELPIIALTADAFEEDRRKCIEAGMNDFLAKPVEIKTLKEVLGIYIRKN